MATDPVMNKIACSAINFEDSQEKWTRRPLEHKYRENVFERTETAATMSGGSSRQVLRQLNTLFHCGVAGPLGDEELLEQFVAGSEEAAEGAFAALVDRHGAMVLGVCRRVLGNRHAAEDAFQATFLVLVHRGAPAIARREQLASWLHGARRPAGRDGCPSPGPHASTPRRNGWATMSTGGKDGRNPDRASFARSSTKSWAVCPSRHWQQPSCSS